MSFLPVYLDTSALVKLVVREDESEALVSALEAWPDRVSSMLAATELQRALRRAGAAPEARRRGDAVLEGVVLLRLDDPLVSRAAAFDDRNLRTLDALHLASALSIGDDPEVFVTYDARLARAAAGAGLTVAHPGVTRLE